MHAAVVEGEVGPDGLHVGGVVGAPAPVVDRGWSRVISGIPPLAAVLVVGDAEANYRDKDLKEQGAMSKQNWLAICQNQMGSINIFKPLSTFP